MFKGSCPRVLDWRNVPKLRWEQADMWVNNMFKGSCPRVLDWRNSPKLRWEQVCNFTPVMKTSVSYANPKLAWKWHCFNPDISHNLIQPDFTMLLRSFNRVINLFPTLSERLSISHLNEISRRIFPGFHIWCTCKLKIRLRSIYPETRLHRLSATLKETTKTEELKCMPYLNTIEEHMILGNR
jgi:hypothetical protein